MDRAGKKTAAAIHQEVTQEVNQLLSRIFAERRRSGQMDLEAVENAFRSALHQAGAAGLSELLEYPAPVGQQRQLPCPCGQHAQYQALRSKPVLTVLGPARVSRPYYLCAQCHQGQFPADAELDIEQTEISPGVRRMMAMVGQQAPFDHGRQQLKLLAGLEVTIKAVERTAEAIGEDIAQAEQQQIQRAVQLDLPIVVGEREVKLGCVFTQTTWDEEGYALRDSDSTTYTGAIETADEFGKRIYLEAWNRGWSRAQKKVVMGDGAEWIWNLADQHFPGAVQIVDLYHARQHLWDLVRKLYPNDPVSQKAWMKVHQKRLLDKGKLDQLVVALRCIVPANAELADKIHAEADYFERNAERMRYPAFRRQHFFVGSGVIEAGCKTVIGARLKQSGMFWTVRGANSIIALRSCHLNARFEDYWESRRAA